MNTRRHPHRSLTLGAATAVLVGWLGIVTEAAGALLAGAAAVDVTPHHFPVRVAGSIGEQTTDKVTTPLHAKALVLADGPVRLGVCIVDNCLLPRDLIDSVKEAVAESAGIPSDHLLVAATHTHSAPPVMGAHGNDPDPEYRAQLEGKMILAVRQAVANLAPAEVAWGSGDCPEHVFCRRWLMKEGTAFTVPFTGRETNRAQMNPGHGNPNKVEQTGPVDPEVTVLSVRHKDGRPLALLANYSTHYVGAPGISADYFGIFGDLAGPALGAAPDQDPPFVGILSNGTSGDANCVDFSREERRDFDMHSVAKAVLDTVTKALEDARYRDDLTLAMQEEEVEFDVRMPRDDEVAEARAWLAENLGDRPVRTWEENYARETVILSGMPPTRKLKLQALRVGESFAITAIPCEVYGETGLALKKASPFPVTMNVGLANGYDGYLPPPAQNELGGYTTWRARTSCLEVEAEPEVRRVLGRLLGSLEP